MGFMELRAVMVGCRILSLPIFLIVSTTQNLKRRQNKTKPQRKSFLSPFFVKKKGRILFIFMHSLLKFKVQRTPTELDGLWLFACR